MFTQEEIRIIVKDINEGIGLEKLVNAQIRINVVNKLQLQAQLQVDDAAKKRLEPDKPAKKKASKE